MLCKILYNPNHSVIVHRLNKKIKINFIQISISTVVCWLRKGECREQGWGAVGKAATKPRAGLWEFWVSLISSSSLLSMWFSLILALSVFILKVTSLSLAQQKTGKSRGFEFTFLSAFSEGRIQIPWNTYQLSIHLVLEHMEGDTWQYKVHRISQRSYSYKTIYILMITWFCRGQKKYLEQFNVWVIGNKNCLQCLTLGNWQAGNIFGKVLIFNHSIFF